MMAVRSTRAVLPAPHLGLRCSRRAATCSATSEMSSVGGGGEARRAVQRRSVSQGRSRGSTARRRAELSALQTCGEHAALRFLLRSRLLQVHGVRHLQR